MNHFLLVAIGIADVTQGGASTRGARACLPWAMVFNAFGVRVVNTINWCHPPITGGSVCRLAAAILCWFKSLIAGKMSETAAYFPR